MASGSYSFGPSLSSAVQASDVLSASDRIAAVVTVLQLQSNESTNGSPIGTSLNQWQRPITEYGSNPSAWEVKLKANPYIGDIEFGRREWARAREAVDAVMDLLLKEMRHNAEKYEGLRIDSYIRQGSSRDGLKVLAADEFDTVIEFHIEGLLPEEITLVKEEKRVPAYCYLGISQSLSSLEKKYTKLYNDGVFVDIGGGKIRLCSRAIHQVVFKSLVDRSCHNIQEKIKETQRQRNPANFSITSRINPPSINITIHLDDQAHELFMLKGEIKNKKEDVRDINIDIVPALLLRYDTKTVYEGNLINCPIHAVCKWTEDESEKAFTFARSDLIWHINSAGYEKFVLDLARHNQRQRYILTALRVLKAFFAKTKQASAPPPQITTVLKSYHLKQIAFYLILYLCFLYPSVRIDGIHDALRYFLGFLREALEARHLPHFFYSNSQIQRMFSNYPVTPTALRFDLFRNKSAEALNQALFSLNNHVSSELGFSSVGGVEQEFAAILGSYKNEIVRGQYF